MEIVASFVAAVGALVMYCKLAPCFAKICPIQSLLAERSSESTARGLLPKMPISMRWTTSGRALKVCDMICEIQKATFPPTLDDRMDDLMVDDSRSLQDSSKNKEGASSQSPGAQKFAETHPGGSSDECDPEDTAAWAYHQCQRIVIQSYCQYTLWGLFRISYASPARPVLVSDDQIVYHPIQDPVGALSVAMAIVRRNPPTADAAVLKNGCMRICYDTRRVLAAVVCISQKMCSHTSLTLRYEDFLAYVFRQVLDSDELPVTRKDWDVLIEAHIRLELSVLNEPLLTMAVKSPLAIAEAELWAMHDTKLISVEAVELGRGCLFLFIAACYTNPNRDAMGELEAQVGLECIGRAGALLTLCLMDAYGKFYQHAEPVQDGHSNGSFTMASVTQCCAKRVRSVPELRAKSQEWKAIRTLLQNASFPHANMFRVGPYRAPAVPGGQFAKAVHPVQNLVAPENIKKALLACPEAMAGREPPAELL